MLYEAGSLKALYIMGEDPIVTFPNSSKIIERLKRLDLLIVKDIALTETAKLAHVDKCNIEHTARTCLLSVF